MQALQPAQPYAVKVAGKVAGKVKVKGQGQGQGRTEQYTSNSSAYARHESQTSSRQGRWAMLVLLDLR